MGEQSQTQADPPQLSTDSPPNVNSISPAVTKVLIDAQISIQPHKIPVRPRKIRKVEAPAAKSPPNGDSGESNPSIRPTKQKLVPQRASSNAVRAAGKSLSRVGEIETALRYLRNADLLLSPLIDLYQQPCFDSYNTPFHALAKSILYQQLNYNAGTSIYTRFLSLCGGEAGVVPETVLALTSQQLRQIGVSGRKDGYLRDLARKYMNGILSDSFILSLDDKSLFTMLTMVNGIGSWSVHMFMIFSLQRPDVLPVNDLSVRKGVQILYGLQELPKPSQMEQLCEKWHPYRSVGAWYMWRLVEAKGSSSNALARKTSSSLRLQQQGRQKQEQQQHQYQHQHPQLQYLDPINGFSNIGACAWRQ